MLRAYGRRLFRSSASTDPWAVLGVRPGDDEDDVKDAFRKLALRLHPDVSRDDADAAKFAAVVEAYEAITQGHAHDSRPTRVGPRGVRIVGGVLLISIEILKQDPDYDVHAVRLRLTDDGAHGSDSSGCGSGGGGSSSSGDDGSGSSALSTEAVREVQASAFDSVYDLRIQLQEELELPQHLRHGGRQGSGHELIYKAQLLGEHLFLADYGVADGDVLHFATRLRR